MKVSDAILALHDCAAVCAAPLEPLVMGVSAALGCVADENVYLAPMPETRIDGDATAVLEPIRPAVPRGSVIGPWQQQVLIAAGMTNVSVIPQPRVVVVAIDDAAAPVHTLTLVSTIMLSGALAMTVQVGAEDDFSDAIDDQLVRADLIVLCAAPTTRAQVRDVCSRLGANVAPLWSGSGLPEVDRMWLGVEQVPALLIGSTVDEHLVAFALAIQPLLAVMLGQRPAGGRLVEPSASEPSLVVVADASAAGDFAGEQAHELGVAIAEMSASTLTSSPAISPKGTVVALPGISARLSTANGADVTSANAPTAVRVTDDMGGQHLISLPQPLSAGLLAGAKGA
ncbi:MAG: hypothetical protein EBU85_02040 [Actinobacteria bacterium]|nr:hypothetical protein [Actinomycetota bacterium]